MLENIPFVTVLPKPNGLPLASTQSPTLNVRFGTSHAKTGIVRLSADSWSVLTSNNAMFVLSSKATMFASMSVLSRNRIVIFYIFDHMKMSDDADLRFSSDFTAKPEPKVRTRLPVQLLSELNNSENHTTQHLVFLAYWETIPIGDLSFR